ncbi:16587_t:CDS:2 [Gigaspora rosea]|nr:16587_t:CDS:2 [Gigaspora rosea]
MQEIKTHTNEFDPAKLETREEETEQHLEEEIDLNHLEREQSEGEIGDLTKELEEETETEGEDEEKPEPEEEIEQEDD